MLIYLLPALIASWLFIRRFVLERWMLEASGRWVFVTGCDSGFGRLLALRLISRRCYVFAGCYTAKGKEELEKVAVELECSDRLFAIPLDVTSDDSVHAAYEFVKAQLAAHNTVLWGIVNNAGVFSIFGPDDWCSIKQYKDSLEVNLLGAVRMCHKFVPLLKHSKGRVVTMGSSAGRIHGQYLAPYCTAKFAVEAYMDCLRYELRPFGVSVHILEPGAFKTDLLNEDAQNQRVDVIWKSLPESVKIEYGEGFRENFKKAWNMGVSIVANPNLSWVVDHYCHALFSNWPRLRYYTGYDAILLFIPLSLLPTGVQDAILSFMYRMQPGPSLVPRSLSTEFEPIKQILVN